MPAGPPPAITHVVERLSIRIFARQVVSMSQGRLKQIRVSGKTVKAGIFCAQADDALMMIEGGYDFVVVVIDDALLEAGSEIRRRFS